MFLETKKHNFFNFETPLLSLNIEFDNNTLHCFLADQFDFVIRFALEKEL